MDYSSEPKPDIIAIAAAAFSGDPDALLLLQELAESGDLDAIGYAEFAEDNFDGEDDC